MMIKIKQAAKYLGVSIKTLQRWDSSGLFKARRTPTNHRYYLKEDLERFKNEEKYRNI